MSAPPEDPLSPAERRQLRRVENAFIAFLVVMALCALLGSALTLLRPKPARTAFPAAPFRR